MSIPWVYWLIPVTPAFIGFGLHAIRRIDEDSQRHFLVPMAIVCAVFGAISLHWTIRIVKMFLPS